MGHAQVVQGYYKINAHHANMVPFSAQTDVSQAVQLVHMDYNHLKPASHVILPVQLAMDRLSIIAYPV